MKYVAIVLALSLLVITGCGGNSNSSTTTVSISLTPTTATLNVSQTVQLTATVTNATNTGVTWQVAGVEGGSATTGTITTAGLYTAPATVTSTMTETITAIAQADTTVTATATITLNPTIVAPTSPLLVSPSQATLPAGAQQTFTASVNGSSSNIAWSVSCQSQTASDCGTISAAGVYTAPFFPPMGGGAIITATATDNSALPGNAPVSIQISNQSLFGKYAFSISGRNGGAFTGSAGSITFDGHGNVTGGVEDITGNSSSPINITGGSYHVGSDGRGTLTIQSAAGNSTCQFVLVNHSHAFLTTYDSGTNVGLGTLDLQDSSQFTLSALQGAYSILLSGSSSTHPSGRLNAAGAFIADGAGAITQGLLDLNDTGTVQTSVSLTGTYTAPSAQGRGTLSLSGSFGTQAFVYYIADGTHVRLLETDSTNSSVVELRRQTTGPFVTGSFHGVFATAISGADNHGPVSTGGLISLNGLGAVTGAVDINNNGNLQGSQAITGTYSVTDATTGRTTMTWNETDGAHQLVFYPSQNGELTVLQLDASSAIGTTLPNPSQATSIRPSTVTLRPTA